jgi:hypothetical protein
MEAAAQEPRGHRGYMAHDANEGEAREGAQAPPGGTRVR